MKDFLRRQVEGVSFRISGLMLIYGFVYYLYKQLALRVLEFHYQHGNFQTFSFEMQKYAQRDITAETDTQPSELSGSPSVLLIV